MQGVALVIADLDAIVIVGGYIMIGRECYETVGTPMSVLVVFSLIAKYMAL